MMNINSMMEFRYGNHFVSSLEFRDEIPTCSLKFHHGVNGNHFLATAFFRDAISLRKIPAPQEAVGRFTPLVCSHPLVSTIRGGSAARWVRRGDGTEATG